MNELIGKTTGETAMANGAQHIVWFDDLTRNEVARVGGKNASLGEMVRNLESRGVKVPPGFATTADAYREFVEANGLNETIASALADLGAGKAPLSEVEISPRDSLALVPAEPDIPARRD